jgi:hypothetical protein
MGRYFLNISFQIDDISRLEQDRRTLQDLQESLRRAIEQTFDLIVPTSSHEANAERMEPLVSTAVGARTSPSARSRL